MSHYADDAVFISPSVLVTHPGSDGTLGGKSAIRKQYALVMERFPKLRFELEEVIERPYGVIVIYRKLGVFAEQPGLTVEVFETSDGLIRRNVVFGALKKWQANFRSAFSGRSVSCGAAKRETSPRRNPLCMLIESERPT